MAGLGKVAGEVFFGGGRAVGQTDVVTVVELVRTSHCEKRAEVSNGGTI